VAIRDVQRGTIATPRPAAYQYPQLAGPFLPLQFRIALLAGVSIVERAGSEIVLEFQRRTIGANRVLFAKIDAGMINPDKHDDCS
jgi:hypothetical protein